MGSLTETAADGISPPDFLLTHTDLHGPAAASGHNGFYAAVVREVDGSVILATDLLGLFPLYYYAQGDRLLFASAPGLLRLHPGVQTRPSPEGIAGLLLTMHLVGDQTIWQGIRRVPYGKVVRWRAGRGTETMDAARLVPGDQYHGFSESEALDRVTAALDGAVRRAATGREVAVMLSGGLDSRLIAGCIHDAAPQRVTALTAGQRGDYEMICASAVARTLRWPHRTWSEDHGKWVEHGRMQAELEGLASSFVNPSWWNGLQHFAEVGKPTLTGHLGDPAMGGSHISWAEDPESADHTFDRMLSRITQYGISPEAARRQLREDFFGDAVTSVIERLRDDFESTPGAPFQRAWVFDLVHRQRLHVAPICWRLALGAWPVLPYADRPLLETMAQMPRVYLVNRRLQYLMLHQRFPHLARLPLDRNNSNIRPPTRNLWWSLRARFEASSLAERVIHRGRERRNYFRVYNLNSPGWVALRQAAEGGRPFLDTMVSHEHGRALVPPPTEAFHLNDHIIEGSLPKSLLGLMLLGKMMEPTP